MSTYPLWMQFLSSSVVLLKSFTWSDESPEFGINNIKHWSILPCITVQAGDGVGDIFLAHFGLLGTNWASLNATATWVHPFMTTRYPSSDGYFQQHNAPCLKAQIISNWFLEHDSEFIVLQWPPVTRSQPCGAGDSHHGCAAWCYHVNVHQNLWGMFLTPFWKYAMKN